MTPAPPARATARQALERILHGALAAVDPARALRDVVEWRGDVLRLDGETLPEGSRVAVLALGKAAVPMAAALEDVLGPRLAAGLAVTRRGAGGRLRRCRRLEAGHPVPDADSAAAAEAVEAFLADEAAGDVLVVALSGGTSSLLSAPAPGLSQADVAEATRVGLAAGLPIEALNALRKHCTRASGGRLARASRARRIFVFAVSDVIGDRLDTIGSGPFFPDATRFEDAIAALRTRDAFEDLPTRIRAHLEQGAGGRVPETPSEGDPAFARVRHRIVASNRRALEGAAQAARREGLRPVPVTERLRGEARDQGRRLVALARSVRGEGLCLLAGGETTVTLRGSGRGGRCQELALAAAIALDGDRRLTLLAAGTDGSDGPTDAAGAFADGGSVARGAERGRSAASHLAENDAYGFFADEGGLLRTGPTGTNVMDLVLCLVQGEEGSGKGPAGAQPRSAP